MVIFSIFIKFIISYTHQPKMIYYLGFLQFTDDFTNNLRLEKYTVQKIHSPTQAKVRQLFRTLCLREARRERTRFRAETQMTTLYPRQCETQNGKTILLVQRYASFQEVRLQIYQKGEE